MPPSRIRTRATSAAVADPARQRIVFGSCRYPPTGDAELERGLGVDALDAYAARLLARDARRRVRRRRPPPSCPTRCACSATRSTPTRRRRAPRSGSGRGAASSRGAGLEIADYPEYAHLYAESWSDPELRWLFSTVPTSMIFDDHDIRDDWNTSQAWREQMAQQEWWPTRIRAGLASYWVYQHAGNLDPDTLDGDELYRAVTSAEGDVWPLLEAYAARADAAVGEPEGIRWSYRWDLGRTRLLMIDSRCGRVLNDHERLMINDATFTWIEQQASEATDDVDHLLLGSSIPWLMPPAASQVQTMNERSAARGQPARRTAAPGRGPRALAGVPRVVRPARAARRAGGRVVVGARDDLRALRGRAPLLRRAGRRSGRRRARGSTS